MAEESGSKKERSHRQSMDAFLNAAAPGLEEVVSSESFGKMLGQAAGNIVALQRIGSSMMDLAVRNARLAGRADVTNLQRQLVRTEDKLETILETVERLEDELAAERRRRPESSE